MRSIRWSAAVRFILAGVLVHAPAVVDAQEVKGADVRALIDGEYPVTRETFMEYQACLAKVGLSQELTAVVAARRACKDAAIKKSLVPTTEVADRATAPATGSPPAPRVVAPAEGPGVGSKESRSVWQSETLKRRSAP